MRRTAHQLFDGEPKVLHDPVALAILSEESRSRLSEEGAAQTAASKYLRAFMVARCRFEEDELAKAVQRGATQYVILGAGLDTFAYRNPYPKDVLRVLEVDHPATQKWKRERLEEARIAIPGSLTFVPVDFEKGTTVEGLKRAGFAEDRMTFFSWLGVIMYLKHEAASSTLKFIAGTPIGGGIVFDYAVPRSSLGILQRMAFDRLAGRVEAAGEPFRLFFAPQELETELRIAAFTSLEDLGVDEINSRYFSDRSDGLRVGGGLGRLMSARI
jgi:methyltransferase (TIGR00027 family)